MAKRKLLTVLYFLNGSSPTADDDAAMSEFGQGYVVRQRNALLIHDGDAIEDFDIVAGLVPAAYQAEADGRDPVEEPIIPTLNADEVPPGSPVAPPQGGQDGEGGGSGTSDAPAAAEGAVAPAGDAAAVVVPPKPKAGGAGWKPNA